MNALFGSSLPLPAQFFIAFLVVLALIGLTAWLVRRFGVNRLGSAARGRQPRLAVIDAASVDGRRRLVLIRRDNIEHLLMIGGPTDIVIEPNIVRTLGAREGAREPARLAVPSEAPMRSAPAPEPSWQPPAVEPVPVAPSPPRSYRAPSTDEPWLPPEPGARARPADSLTGLAAELSARLAPPEAGAAVREAQPPRTIAPPVTPDPPTAPPQSDHNLAEMAQQLEAALRRAPAPEGRPPVTDALAVPPLAKAPAPPRQVPRDFRVRSEPKFEAPKVEPPKSPEAKVEPKFETVPELKAEPRHEPKPDQAAAPKPAKVEPKPEAKPEAPTAPDKAFYDNLEEEMASLLGRPHDKS
jgi:hypothetical protein